MKWNIKDDKCKKKVVDERRLGEWWMKRKINDEEESWMIEWKWEWWEKEILMMKVVVGVSDKNNEKKKKV